MNNLERTYHTINETQARQAKNMWSFSEYIPGSETAEYTAQVDEVYSLGETAIKNGADIDKVRYYCERFAKQYAEWKNKSFRIELMCPSVMISGASNFPVRKKEKQNAARGRHFDLYNQIMSVKDKLKSINDGSYIIKSGDEDAVERLQEKLDGLKQFHETMKAANAYYRKHKTLDGFSELSEDMIDKIKAFMSHDWRQNPVPFEAYTLQNNLQNIKSVE